MNKKSAILHKLKSNAKMPAFGGSKSSAKKSDNQKDIAIASSSSILPSKSGLSSKEIKKQQEKQIKLQTQLVKQEAKQQLKQLKLQQKKEKATATVSPSTASSAVAATGTSGVPVGVASSISNDPVALSRSKSIDHGTSSAVAMELLDEESRFAEGRQFRGKLIGIEPVMAAQGDEICQAAFKNLRLRRTSSGHKQRILINVKLSGVQLLDAKTRDLVANHANHLISYITRDTQDDRSFGYIYGTGEIGHQFIAIKCEKNAMFVLTAIGELFTYVYNRKKKEKQEQQQQQLAVSGVSTGPTIFTTSVSIPTASSVSTIPTTVAVATPPSTITTQPLPIASTLGILQPITVNIPSMESQSKSVTGTTTTVTAQDEGNRNQPGEDIKSDAGSLTTSLDRPFVSRVPNNSGYKQNAMTTSASSAVSSVLVPPPPPPRNAETLNRTHSHRPLGTYMPSLESYRSSTKSGWKSGINTMTGNEGPKFANWQIFNEEEQPQSTISSSNLNRTNSIQSQSSNNDSFSSSLNTMNAGFVDSFMGEANTEWPPMKPPPREPAPQLQLKQNSAISLNNSSTLFQTATESGSATIPRLTTPPSTISRRRPRRSSDSYRSNSSSLADTSIDLPSAVLDSDATIGQDDSSTLRLQQADSGSDLNSSTLCMSSGGLNVSVGSSIATKSVHHPSLHQGIQGTGAKVGDSSSLGNNESRCTSKLGSASSVFSVSSFGTPSPRLSRKSPAKLDLACEAITARLQTMSAQLDVDNKNITNEFTIEQAFGPNHASLPFKQDHQAPQERPASYVKLSSSKPDRFDEPVFSAMHVTWAKVEDGQTNEQDKYAVFHQQEVLQSSSIFDPLINTQSQNEPGDVVESTDHVSSSMKNDADTNEKGLDQQTQRTATVNANDESKKVGTFESIAEITDLSSLCGSFAELVSKPKTLPVQERVSLNVATDGDALISDTNESGQKSADSFLHDVSSLHRHYSRSNQNPQHANYVAHNIRTINRNEANDDRKRSIRSNSDASTTASLNLSNLSLNTNSVFDAFSSAISGPVGTSMLDPAMLLNRTSEVLSSLEKHFERARVHLQIQQRQLNKQHLQQQQRLLQQQKQLLIDFNRQAKQRLQSQPPQVIVTARAQQQLQQKRLQQQFVQQQQMLKQIQQTQQMQLLDQLQQLQQSYLERKSTILASTDSPDANDEAHEEEEAAAQVPNIFESQRTASMFALNEPALDSLSSLALSECGSLSMLHMLGLDTISTTSDPIDPLLSDLTMLGPLSNPNTFSCGSSPLLQPERCSTSCSIASTSSHNPFLLDDQRSDAGIRSRITAVLASNSNGANRVISSRQSLDPLSFSQGSGGLLPARMQPLMSESSSRSEDALSLPYNQSGRNDFGNRSCNATFESLLGNSDRRKHAPQMQHSIERSAATFKQAIVAEQQNEESADPFNCNFVDNKLNEITRISQIRHQTQRQLMPIANYNAAHSPGSLCSVNPPISPFVRNDRSTHSHISLPKTVDSGDMSGSLFNESIPGSSSTIMGQDSSRDSGQASDFSGSSWIDTSTFDPFASRPSHLPATKSNPNTLGQFNSYSAFHLDSLVDKKAIKLIASNPTSASTLHLPSNQLNPVKNAPSSSSTPWFNHFTSEQSATPAATSSGMSGTINSPPERNIFQVKKDPFEDDFFR